MTKIRDFNLALSVINNILICDKDNTIYFVGDDIRKILFGSRKSIKKNLLGNFNNPVIIKGLQNKIDIVRNENISQSFDFETIDKTIFIFPANYMKKDNIILSTKEQLLKANKIEQDLKERVKELKCLYDIINELERTRYLPGALKESVKHLRQGFQFPEQTVATIILDGIIYRQEKPDIDIKKLDILTEKIVVKGKNRGKIEIFMRKGTSYLPEELRLVREIALLISKAIEKEETQKDIEKQRKLLLSQNIELKELTDNLTSSNNNLSALFNAITDIIVVIDEDFNITMSNKEKIAKGGKCFKNIFGFDSQCKSCPSKKVFRLSKSFSDEKKVSDQYYKIRAYPILNKKGVVERVIETCRNITMEKQMEHQLIQSYKLASLGKLVAGVAHEINNPNTFIRGNIKIISEAFSDIIPILDNQYDENPGLKIARLNYELFKENIYILLEDMLGGANRIKKIVDGLRNFARKDEGLLTDDVDINGLIQNNLRITAKEVRRNSVLKLDYGSDIPVFKGNIQKLEQTLMNFLINASQAIENKQGLITMQTNYNKSDNEIIIKISDNGKGIDDKIKKQIFDPFFTTKRNRGGTGLGLSISYGIIKEHNGRIELDSKVGEGTCFTILIPVIKAEMEKQ